MKSIKITYKNGKELVLENIHDYSVHKNLMCVVQKTSDVGMPSLYNIGIEKIEKVCEV